MNDVRAPHDAPRRLQELLNDFEMPLYEIAVMADTNLSEIQAYQLECEFEPGSAAAKDSALAGSIGQLYELVTSLGDHSIEPGNIRAFLLGHSAYLNEQRPATLWRAGYHQLVKEASTAYATSETPKEFLESRDDIPYISEDLD